jgi:hypothetical protein
LTLHFWGIYEMGFPEGSNVKAPMMKRIWFKEGQNENE